MAAFEVSARAVSCGARAGYFAPLNLRTPAFLVQTFAGSHAHLMPGAAWLARAGTARAYARARHAADVLGMIPELAAAGVRVAHVYEPRARARCRAPRRCVCHRRLDQEGPLAKGGVPLRELANMGPLRCLLTPRDPAVVGV